MEPMYRFHDYCLLPAQRQLLAGKQAVKLGSRAFDMLVALVERRDRVVGKHELMDLVWPRLVVEDNNLQVQVMALRKLLGYGAIGTVPGRGYRFTLPVATDRQSTRSPAPPESEPSRSRQSNLPQDRSDLIGRSEDLRALRELVALNTLVTIAGAGGIGKTRLARAVAAAEVGAGPGGVWWVDLSALDDPTRVEDAVARAMGLHDRGGTDAVDRLWPVLRGEPALLVLDNAEHLLAGVAEFAARLRREASHTRLLVTSQEVLRTPGEQVFRPEPLSLPDADDPATVDTSAAVALFVVRARAASRAFSLDDDKRPVVAEICRRLDGIPLAIELAAARVQLLGITGLRDKLDQRFHVLTGGHRVALRRHQTLRAALEWSHQLLQHPEQAVLRRLSVFTGGFDLDAAQHVAEDDESIDPWDVLEHLGALVDKSLVVVSCDARPRYRLLETTRQFALERLIESGEANAVRERHLEYFLDLAEVSGAQLFVGDARRHFIRLDLEHGNLMLALSYGAMDEDGTKGLRLASALTTYWFLRAMPTLGLQVTCGVLDRANAAAATPQRCRALATAGWMAMWAGKDDAALSYLLQALDLARTFADPALLLPLLPKLAHVHLRRGEVAPAQERAAEALEVARAAGDDLVTSDAQAVNAQIALHQGERASARSFFSEALALRRRLGIPSGVMSMLLALARLAIDDGAPDEGHTCLRETLALLPQVDSQMMGVHLISVAGEWASEAGHHEAALTLAAARTRQFDRFGMPQSLSPLGLRRLERSTQAVGAEAATRLHRVGREMSYEQAMLEAGRLLNG